MEEQAVNDIMKILTQDGMTTGQAKDVLQRVQLLVLESSKNFLDQSEAKGESDGQRQRTDNAPSAAGAEREAPGGSGADGN